MSFDLSMTAYVTAILYATLTLLVGLRVVSMRRPVGVSLAWLMLLFAFPFVGIAMYVFVGEAWLSRRRSRRTAQLARRLFVPVAEVTERFGSRQQCGHPASCAMQAIGEQTGYIPTLTDNDIEMLNGAEESFQRMIDDIDQAQRSCDLMFYIWSPGGSVDNFVEAIVRARQRGITCRILVDAVGGRPLLGNHGDRLRSVGVQIRASLPVNLLRFRLSRIDLRNHRKLAVIDDCIAYTGSLNIADPKLFKQHAGVGQWIDIMARVRGPSAGLMSALFELDWSMEDNDRPDVAEWIPKHSESHGDAHVQVVPSGPGQNPQVMYSMLLSAAHNARNRLILTTPYLVPDDAFMAALVTSSMRGVQTDVVVPARYDGLLVGLASQACCDQLIAAGVRVWAYKGGLLHAKTITVDGALGMVGSVNLDRRSFWLNYELSLIFHGGHAVADLEKIQHLYLAQSSLLGETEWSKRSWPHKLAENVAQLFSPVL
jgi:cardiolipin synthase A/B